MLKDKGTLSLYKFNSEVVIKHLTNEQSGRLFKAILRYGIDGEMPDFSDDGMVSMMFDLYRKGIDELDEKYRVQRQKKVDAGHKGGITKRSSAKQNETVLSSAKQTKEKEANPSLYVDVYGDGDGDGDGYGDGEEELNNNIPDTFEKIWKAYPLKEGKDRGCRAYIDCIRDGWEPEQLLKATEHYANHCGREEIDRKFVVRIWNFFNNGVFKDYLEESEDDADGPTYQLRNNFYGS